MSAGEVAFANRLIARLPITAPGVDPARVVALGATELRKYYSGDQLSGIILAYMDGLKVVYAIAIAAAGSTLFVAAASRWKSLKGGNAVTGAV